VSIYINSSFYYTLLIIVYTIIKKQLKSFNQSEPLYIWWLGRGRLAWDIPVLTSPIPPWKFLRPGRRHPDPALKWQFCPQKSGF